MAKYLMQTALGAAIAASVAATPAFSQSVVEELLGKMTESGGTVTFDKSQDGSTTTWSNIVAEGPDGDGKLTIDWVKEVENGDAYTITMAPEAVMSFVDAGNEGTMTLGNDGLAYLVNRSGDGLSMAYSATSISFSIAAEPDLTDFTFTFNNVAGNDTFEGADWASGSGQMQAGSMGMTFGVDDGDVAMEMDGSYDDISLTYAYAGFSPVVIEQDPAALLNALVRFEMISGGGSGSGTIGEEGQKVSFTFSGGSSGAAFDMSDGNVTYSGEAAEIAYNVNPSEMGFPPFDVSMANAGFEFALPIAKKDEAGDVRYLIELLGLEVSEGLWRMIDPGQTIPRDPADLVIDLAATAKWLISPAEMGDNPPQAMPFEVEDVTVNEIRVSIGGAEISANGSAQMMNGGPFPLPIGKLDIAINGVNGLIDKLTNLGLLTPDRILPVRALMGLYTTPVGDDQMTSSIEMTADGQILANGLPLPN